MGGALLQGWLASGLRPGDVTVVDPYPSDGLRETGVTINPETLGPARFAVVAVKPQMIRDAAPTLGTLAGSKTVFLSVAAGTGISAFEEMYGAKTPVIRAMPNTPSAIGQGISALIGNQAASDEDMEIAEALMATVGKTVRLDTESQMDAVTGLSGSGPAYVFHLIEAMARAGVSQGLPPDLSMNLAKSTVCGAGMLASASGDSVEQLRINVTSPAGTTAAGLDVLMAELPELMRRTVAAATERSRELG
ncbi:MAG: pyrroline-5-carboxylate reductase [Pseudomonadota bacterium]